MGRVLSTTPWTRTDVGRVRTTVKEEATPRRTLSRPGSHRMRSGILAHRYTCTLSDRSTGPLTVTPLLSTTVKARPLAPWLDLRARRLPRSGQPPWSGTPPRFCIVMGKRCSRRPRWQATSTQIMGTDNFDAEGAQARLVLVDFWAPGAARAASSRRALKEIALERRSCGSSSSTSTRPQTAARFQVLSIPDDDPVQGRPAGQDGDRRGPEEEARGRAEPALG